MQSPAIDTALHTPPRPVCLQPNMGKDYYSILGVERGASDDRLKSAYKKQAVLHHPDKNPNQREAAEARFKEVAGAYR